MKWTRTKVGDRYEYTAGAYRIARFRNSWMVYVGGRKALCRQVLREAKDGALRHFSRELEAEIAGFGDPV